MKRIAPSILSSDFSRLGEEIRAVEAAGADLIHVDVMDGHFVPNLTIGPAIIRSIRKATALPFDVHLMIDNPDAFVDEFLAAGSDFVTVHVETSPHLHRTIQAIKKAGKRAGVSVNPATPLTQIEYILQDIDLLLVMTVNPGFGGQEFIESMLPKIVRAREMIDRLSPATVLEVDGGATWSADLTGLFSYNRDSYQQGTAEISLSRVPAGLHSFRFRAADNALNVARLELMLNVTQSAGSLVLSEVLNYPNPFSDKTTICFEVNQAAEVIIRIFTVAGRPVRQLKAFAPSAGYQMVDWDGTDEYKQKVANGVYLYKIICRTSADLSSSQEVEAVGKALLSR